MEENESKKKINLSGKQRKTFDQFEKKHTHKVKIFYEYEKQKENRRVKCLNTN